MKAIGTKISDALFLRTVQSTKSKKNSTPNTSRTYGHVILAPSSRGNLGDEAMLTASLGEIRNRTNDNITVLTHSDADDWSDVCSDINQVSIQGYFSPLDFRKPIRCIAEVFSKAKSFSILGADVMDGAYSRSRTMRRIAMADLATSLDLKTQILGFSYSDKYNPETHAYLKSISSKITINARDIKSYDRLKSLSDGEVNHVADTAFLLKPAENLSETAQKAISFAEQHRLKGKKVLAFNANPLGTSMSAGAKKGSEQLNDLSDLVSKQVSHILTKDTNIVLIFIPHDPREPHNDRSLLQRTYNDQNSAFKERIFLAFDGISARDVKSICEVSDTVVTGRMHMGIASLGVETPAIFLDFQGKVQGLLDHFQVPELSFDWELYRQPERFSEFVLSTLYKSQSYRETISSNHAKVVALSRSNFSTF